MLDEYEKFSITDAIIGKGGGGTVFKVKKISDGMYYALKRIELPPTENNTSRQTISELKSLINLKNPGVVRMYSYKFSETMLYIEMDYVQGKSLDKLIYSNSLSYEDGIQHMTYILGTMNYVHNQKITHLDIKPANIVIRDDRVPILVDFGCSVLLKTNKNTYTQLTNPQGTPGYIAPEIILETKKFNPRLSDIYSLGATLYTLLTQKTVYDTASKYLYEKSIHENTPIIPPHQINKKIPKSISEICMKALERNPKKRYSTCNAFRKAIETMKPAEGKKSFFTIVKNILNKPAVALKFKSSTKPSTSQEINYSHIYDNLSPYLLKNIGMIKVDFGGPLINIKFQGDKLLTFTEAAGTKVTQCQVFDLNNFSLLDSSINDSSEKGKYIHTLGYNSSKNFFGYSLKDNSFNVARHFKGENFRVYEGGRYGFSKTANSSDLLTYNNEKTSFAVASSDLLLFPYNQYTIKVWNSKTRYYPSYKELSSMTHFLQQNYHIERCHFFLLDQITNNHMLIAQTRLPNQSPLSYDYRLISQVYDHINDKYAHVAIELSDSKFDDLSTALSKNTFVYSPDKHKILAPTKNGYSIYAIDTANHIPHIQNKKFDHLIYESTITNDNDLSPIALLPNGGQIINIKNQSSYLPSSYFYLSKNNQYQELYSFDIAPILTSHIKMNDSENLLAVPYSSGNNQYPIGIYEVEQN